MHCNVFEITDDEWASIGLGLYLKGARFNHDCEPNCAATFDGPALMVHTLRPCAADEEVTTPRPAVGAAWHR